MDALAAVRQAEDERAATGPVHLGVDDGAVLVGNGDARLEAERVDQELQGTIGVLVVEDRPQLVAVLRI